jgi:hypothetical protein
MATDPKFLELVDMLSASTNAARHRQVEKDKLEAEGTALAAQAFEPIANFLSALAAALKNGVDDSISLTTDGDWIASNGLDYYMLFYELRMPSLGSFELLFQVTGDYRRVEFEKHDFEITEQTAIENALKAWVVSKLKT